jgi:hypothetical protein
MYALTEMLGKPSMFKVGSIRKRLAGKLIAAFKTQFDLELRLDPKDLHPAEGYWRSDVRADCQRWEGFGQIKHPETGNWMGVTLDSWSTMTSCLKALSIRRESFCAFNIEENT